MATKGNVLSGVSPIIANKLLGTQAVVCNAAVSNGLIAVRGHTPVALGAMPVKLNPNEDAVVLKTRPRLARPHIIETDHVSNITKCSSRGFTLNTPWMEAGISHMEDILMHGFRLANVDVNRRRELSTYHRYLSRLRVVKGPIFGTQQLLHDESYTYLSEGHDHISRQSWGLFLALGILGVQSRQRPSKGSSVLLAFYLSHQNIWINCVRVDGRCLPHVRVLDVYNALQQIISSHELPKGRILDDVIRINLTWDNLQSSPFFRTATLHLIDGDVQKGTPIPAPAPPQENLPVAPEPEPPAPTPQPTPTPSPPQGTGVFRPIHAHMASGSQSQAGGEAMNGPHRIIIHHTVGNDLPQDPIPYHFVVDFNGIVHYGRETTRTAPGTSRNNYNSIHIAVLGNWDTNDSTIAATPGNMSVAQTDGLIAIIADVLIAFTSIPTVIRFNLPIEQMRHYADGSRHVIGHVSGWADEDLNDRYRRHSNHGIKGHDDGLNEAQNCPGRRLYNWCRDDIVPRAIALSGR